MSTNQQTISLPQLITAIATDLTEYLSKNYYEECGEERKRELERYGYISLFPVPPSEPHQPLTYVAVYDNGNRDNDLTAKRISNILKVRNDLYNLQGSTSSDEEVLDKIREGLNLGIQANSYFSDRHKKIHRSYQQNKALRPGFFGRLESWWNATWFQSRAQLAFEKALKTLDRFEAMNNHTSTKRFG